MLTTVVLAEEQLRELPIASEWVGGLVLGVFVVLVMALLAFGKGRPHT